MELAYWFSRMKNTSNARFIYSIFWIIIKVFRFYFTFLTAGGTQSKFKASDLALYKRKHR
jgi:hypothetical protein